MRQFLQCDRALRSSRKRAEEGKRWGTTRRQIRLHEEWQVSMEQAISKAAGPPFLLSPSVEHVSVSEPPARSQLLIICSIRKEVENGWGGHRSQEICVGVLYRATPTHPLEHTLISGPLQRGRLPGSVLEAEVRQPRRAFDPSDPLSS